MKSTRSSDMAVSFLGCHELGQAAGHELIGSVRLFPMSFTAGIWPCVLGSLGPILAALIGSGALTLGPLLDQLLDRSRECGLEVDEFDPHRGDDYPDHAVVERADLGLPLGALRWGHFIAAVDLQVLLRDAVHYLKLRSTADEQDLRRVHLGVDRQRDLRVVPQ